MSELHAHILIIFLLSSASPLTAEGEIDVFFSIINCALSLAVEMQLLRSAFMTVSILSSLSFM